MVCCSLYATAYADSTKCHGALEYCELYTVRLPAALELAGVDEESVITREWVADQTEGDVITVAFEGGILDISLEDFSILSLNTTLYDYRKTEEENSVIMARCIASFSALEYDDADNSLFKWYAESGAGSQSKNAIEESFRIWDETISQTFGKSVADAVRSGEEILIYSGNYDYYLVFFSRIKETANPLNNYG